MDIYKRLTTVYEMPDDGEGNGLGGIKETEDDTKKQVLKSVENSNYEEMINNIKTYEDLSNFIKLFKGESKEKLDFKYFRDFTNQLVKYIDNIKSQDKMLLFKDVFGHFQLNEFDPDGHIFSRFMSKDNNECSGLFFYIEDRLLKSPMTYKELPLNNLYPDELFI